jgi:hypothetical protein
VLLRLHTARSTCTGIARISLVLMLALVLVAGLIPSGALSASQSCKMACCAGKPPHEAGACHAFLTNAVQTETTQPTDADEHAARHHEMQMPGADVERATEPTLSSDHCQATAQLASIHQASAPSTAPGSEPRQRPGLAARSFTTRCSEECAAAALMLVQLRRPREVAALAIAALRPRAPTLISKAHSLFNLKTSSAELRRRIRPRAPPVSLVNLSA